MDSHIKVLGWIHIAFGVLGVLVGGLLGGFGKREGLFSGEEGGLLAGGIVGVHGMFIAALSVPALLGGWGLLSYRPWARILVLILGFLNLFSFPIGTLIGGFSVYVLLKDEAKRQFEGGGAWPEPRYDALPGHDDELARFDEQLARMREAQRSDAPRAY